jgi:hypothetical protein
MGLMKDREVLNESAQLLSIVVRRLGVTFNGQRTRASGDVDYF